MKILDLPLPVQECWRRFTIAFPEENRAMLAEAEFIESVESSGCRRGWEVQYHGDWNGLVILWMDDGDVKVMRVSKEEIDHDQESHS